MARPKKYTISLYESDVNKLQSIIRKKVFNIVKDYIELGPDASVTFRRNPISDAKCKADGRNEAHIIEPACSHPLRSEPAKPCVS